MMLKSLEIIYHWLGDSRNFLFEKNILKAHRLSVPVISVGNISFGGVGKTPCIVWLARELSNSFKVSVVAKSYKGRLKSPALVDPKLSDAATVFGDEACLLAEKLPDCQVWAGPVKWKTASMAHKNRNGLMLVDDGFSHRELKRNFDLVLVDALAGLDGYLREKESNLSRASAVLITKVNLAGAEKTAALKKKLQQLVKVGIFQAASVSFLNLQPQSDLFVFCALGNPAGFLRDLEMQGFIVRGKIMYADHHHYTSGDQTDLLARFSEMQKRFPRLKLVCTEKDFVKITDAELKKQLHVPEHSLQLAENEKEDLLAQIRKSL